MAETIDNRPAFFNTLPPAVSKFNYLPTFLLLGGGPKKKRKCSAVMEHVIAVIAPFCDGFSDHLDNIDWDGGNGDDSPSRIKNERNFGK